MNSRFALRVLTGTAAVVFFVGLAAALHARDAIAVGAVGKPVICLNARHFDDWKAGKRPQAYMDGLVVREILRVEKQRSQWHQAEHHLRGMWVSLGFWLGYDSDQRRMIAMQMIGRMQLCPQDREKYEILKAKVPASDLPILPI